jgi:hypothetical protein
MSGHGAQSGELPGAQVELVSDQLFLPDLGLVRLLLLPVNVIKWPSKLIPEFTHKFVTAVEKCQASVVEETNHCLSVYASGFIERIATRLITEEYPKNAKMCSHSMPSGSLRRGRLGLYSLDHKKVLSAKVRRKSEVQ